MGSSGGAKFDILRNNSCEEARRTLAKLNYAIYRCVALVEGLSNVDAVDGVEKDDSLRRTRRMDGGKWRTILKQQQRNGIRLSHRPSEEKE